MNQTSAMVRTGATIVQMLAAGMTLCYLALLTVQYLLAPERPDPLSLTIALASVVINFGIWQLYRRGYSGSSTGPALVVALTPAVQTLVVLSNTGDIHATTPLMLILMGGSAVLPTIRSMALFTALIWVPWALMFGLGHLSPTEETDQYLFYLCLATVMAAFLFAVRYSTSHALERARSQASAQYVDLERTQASLKESERRFREMFTASPVGVALADENGLFSEVNDAWCELLGRTPEELLGHSSREFTHPDDLPQHAGMRQTMDEAVKTDGIVRVEKRWIRPNGEIRWGWLSIAAVHGPDGQRWTLAHAQDVTERKAVEADLQRSRATLAGIARMARSVQSGEDPRPVLLEELRRLSGAGAVAVLEDSGAGLLEVTGAIGTDAVGSLLTLGENTVASKAWESGKRELLIGRHPQARRGTDRRSSVTPNAMEVLIPPWAAASLWQPVLEQGQVIALLVIAWDDPIAEPADPELRAVQALAAEAAAAFTAARLRDELRSLADTDPLTGVANRRGWHTQVRELTTSARGNGQPLTLAVVDLDHFKKYNDTYGHHRGDVLLREFAARANAMLRSGDVIARWGGEEFAVALPGCGGPEAAHILERLRGAMPGDQTCSIGYAVLLPDESPTDCLVRADNALYEAKHRGRNQVVVAP
ncbi:sensor domain-containing diguanylate cyclase [Nakamurella silvestris]|nr:sensor domain-containing diguanylate cyclase [Nakamurella silvestris]